MHRKKLWTILKNSVNIGTTMKNSGNQLEPFKKKKPIDKLGKIEEESIE